MWRVLVIFIVIVGSVGYFRGWFHMTSSNLGDKSNVTLTVDKNKIDSDDRAAKDKANDMTAHP